MNNNKYYINFYFQRKNKNLFNKKLYELNLKKIRKVINNTKTKFHIDPKKVNDFKKDINIIFNKFLEDNNIKLNPDLTIKDYIDYFLLITNIPAIINPSTDKIKLTLNNKMTENNNFSSSSSSSSINLNKKNFNLSDDIYDDDNDNIYDKIIENNNNNFSLSSSSFINLDKKIKRKSNIKNNDDIYDNDDDDDDNDISETNSLDKMFKSTVYLKEKYTPEYLIKKYNFLENKIKKMEKNKKNNKNNLSFKNELNENKRRIGLLRVLSRNYNKTHTPQYDFPYLNKKKQTSSDNKISSPIIISSPTAISDNSSIDSDVVDKTKKK
jgi:hypothetical protein